MCIDRLTEQLSFDKLYLKDQAGKVTGMQDDYTLKALNTLSIMSGSMATLIRTHYITRGKGGAILQTIEDALEEIRLEMGL